MKYILSVILVAMTLLSTVQADEDTQAAVLVKTATVSERDVSESLPAFGSVEPAPHETVTLAAPRDSRIASLAVNNGEAVKKGQALLTLAPTPASAIAFVQAQSAATYAETALAHTRNLYAEHLATRDQVAAAEQARDDARAGLENAQQAGGAGTLVLRAPADAVVMTVNVKSGEQVTANTALLELGFRGALMVRLGVAPDQAGEVHAGMAVILHDVYNSALQFKAKVTNVSGMVDANSGLADVFVRLPTQVAGLMPGSYVQGTITLEDIRGPAVPRSAVLEDDKQAYVFIVKQDVAHRVAITRLADDGSWIAVKGDLKPGSEVVTLGNYELDDDMQIRKAPN